jgi:hypothetical protein
MHTARGPGVAIRIQVVVYHEGRRTIDPIGLGAGQALGRLQRASSAVSARMSRRMTVIIMLPVVFRAQSGRRNQTSAVECPDGSPALLMASTHQPRGSSGLSAPAA